MKNIKYKKMLNFSYEVMVKSGVNKNISKIVSEGLCSTSLRGTDSHGIRLLEHYSKSAISGRKNPKPKIKIKKPFQSIISLDADNTFGHYVGIKAVDEGMKIAKKNGICLVSVFNSTHCGALAHSAIHGAKKGYIVMSFTNADSLALTFNSKETFFGTNPICFAAPRLNQEPFCLDMATTQISWNKMLERKNKNQNFNEKVLADKNGNPTGNTKIASSLLSIGGYKGFGLAMLVEILCGVYSGMNVGKEIPAMFTTPIDLKRKLAQLYIVIRTDGVISNKKFITKLSKVSNQIRKQKTFKSKKVMVADDPEIKIRKERIKKGIPLTKEINDQINRLSKKFQIKNIL